MNKINEKQRIEWIDYLKAFACFLVVIGHLIQSLQKANLDNYINISTYINWFIYLFHMPLFMCISGILYFKTKKNFSWDYYRKFEFKKVINLLVPYITFYLLFVGLNVLFSKNVNNPKSIEDILNIFNNPMPPYWFLYALLSIFIIIPIIERILNNNNKLIFIIIIILKILSIYIHTKIYIIDSFMSYAIYFYLGTFINVNIKFSKIKSYYISIFSIIIYVIMSIIYYNSEFNYGVCKLIDIIFAIIGILICINIFKEIKVCKVLDTFKKYTFQIYLTHTIFAAGTRIFLLKFGISNYIIHFIIGLIVSIYMPVIMSYISEKIKYTNFFFYPLKTIEEIKERNRKC